ncbi:glutathione S-transferase [Geminicoccaceae bacterium 1502E]|nr:glutathione S-transferase [Geminicoccaceae bacterium 1502E]
MRLLNSGASPFARKVRVVAHELGLQGRVAVEDVAASPVSPSEAVSSVNPLGKIPALVLEDGSALYDSRVICEYLDSLGGGGRVFPAAAGERFEALRLQALADGLLDAALAARYETMLRPEPFRWSDWVSGQKGKVARALDRLEEECAGLGERVDIGTIAIGCALGYLDLRFADDRWRDGRPKLAAWYERFAARPSMQATRPE